ncbi:unnamed protein product [Caretta caretta]
MDPAAEHSWWLERRNRVYFSHLAVHTAGVATLFSPNLWLEVLGVAKTVQGCLLHLQVHMEGLVVNLINVCAPTLGPEQLRFYQQASAYLGTLDPCECLVLGGDFNTTLKEWARLGTEQCLATVDFLRETVEHHSLGDVWRDLHPDDISTFTFVQVEAHRLQHSQLDRIYLSQRPGPAYWHFNNSLLEDVGFVASFQEFWLAWRGQWRAFPSVRRWWNLGKVRAWLFCCDYTRAASRRRDAVIQQLEREVLELERPLATSPEEPSFCGVCREKWEELQTL